MTLSHFWLLPNSEGRLRFFLREKGQVDCQPAYLPAHWGWTGELLDVSLLRVAPGFLSLSAGVVAGSQGSSPGQVSSSTTSNGRMTRPGRLPAEFQEQFSFAAEIFQMLNSLSVPLTGAAAKPFFLDSFLNIRALCKWNKRKKEKRRSLCVCWPWWNHIKASGLFSLRWSVSSCLLFSRGAFNSD